MPSGAKKRKAAKKAQQALHATHSLQQHILSEQEATTAESKRVVMFREDDSSMNKDIMDPIEVRHQQTDTGSSSPLGSSCKEAPPLTSEGSMSKAELHLEGAEADQDEKMILTHSSGEGDSSSLGQQSVRRQEDVGDIMDGSSCMEAPPVTLEGSMSNAELHLEEAEADKDEKMTSRHSSREGNSSSFGESTRRQQDVGDEGMHATSASARDVKTSLELRSEDVSSLVLLVSSNGDSHEDIGGCVSCLHNDSLCSDKCLIGKIPLTSTTDTDNANEEQVSTSIDKEDHLPCPCVDNTPPSGLPTATILHQEDSTVKHLVLAQSSPPNKEHVDQVSVQELSLTSRWWGCCGIFDLLLHKS